MEVSEGLPSSEGTKRGASFSVIRLILSRIRFSEGFCLAVFLVFSLSTFERSPQFFDMCPLSQKDRPQCGSLLCQSEEVRVKEFSKSPPSQPKLGNGISSPSSGVTNYEPSLGPTLKKATLHKDMNTKGQVCWDSLQKLLSITSTQSFTKGS